MDNNFRTPRSSNRRLLDQARIQRSSTVTGEAANTAWPEQRRINSNASNRTPSRSRVLPESARFPLQRLSENPPPQYDELYPPARSTVARRPARPRPSPPKGMDPLVAAMWHNENLSLLHSLPDHLLLRIIGMLNNTGVECLRRVARKFPPLCVREILIPSRGYNPRLSETGPMNWPRFGTSSYLRPQVLELVDRDEYCRGCLETRKSSQWEQRLIKLTEYIHCSACGADHPACLFSATQRLKPARLRYCIAHEGYMRICDHEAGTIRLDSLLNPEHRKQSWYQRKPEDPSFTVLRCKHPSHDKSCRKVPGGSFSKSKSDCGSQGGFCNGVRWPAIRCREPGSRIFDIYWTAHMLFDGNMDSVRVNLAEIQDNAGRYIVPSPTSATEGPELRCFDPNDCHCVTYSGTENVRWEWECGPWIPGETKCISDPYRGLNALLPPPPSRSFISNIVRSLNRRQEPECTAEPKGHQSRDDSRPHAYGPGRSIVDIRPCHIGKDCLAVDYVRTVQVQESGKITPQWYNTIDTDSYGITGDQDGLGVYWCSQPRCRNYHKGILNYAGILRGREFRKECRHYDCQ